MIIVPGRAEGVPSEERGATFTGEVWAQPIMARTDDVTMNDVFFTPGARTNWHVHERGQVLRVNSGSGLVCAEGDTPQVVRTGDTVWAPPGERHWHGGSAEGFMQHTAISLGTTTWLEPVTDDDYAGAE